MSGDKKIRAAHTPVEPLEMGSTKYVRKIRTGKTAKDHKSGAWGKRFKNQAARKSYFEGSRHAGPNPVTNWPYGQSVPNVSG